MRTLVRLAALLNGFSLIATAVAAQSSNLDPAMMELQKQMIEMHSQMARMQKRIAELEAATSISPTTSEPSGRQPDADETKKRNEPVSLQYKGLSLTPGGFLEGTFLVRTRNENA